MMWHVYVAYQVIPKCTYGSRHVNGIECEEQSEVKRVYLHLLAHFVVAHS